MFFNLERIDHSRLVRMRKHSFMTMRHDAFFSPAYLVARYHVCQSVKTKNAGHAYKKGHRWKLCRNASVSSGYRGCAWKAQRYIRVQHNIPFHHLTVRSSMKPQHVEYEFLLHHHLYLTCHHVISYRTLTQFRALARYTVPCVRTYIYAVCLNYFEHKTWNTSRSRAFLET